MHFQKNKNENVLFIAKVVLFKIQVTKFYQVRLEIQQLSWKDRNFKDYFLQF